MHPLVGLGGGSPKRNESLVNIIWLPKINTIIKRLRDSDQDTDTDSENESFLNTTADWPGFLVVESASVDLPLSNLSPFATQKGFQAIAATLKSTKRLRYGSYLVECARKPQAMGLLKTTQFTDRPVRVSIHKALNSSRGVIRCRELSGMTEEEIKTELQEQGVVEVHRVTVKKDTEKGPHQHPVSDLHHSRPPERGHGRLSKGEGGLVCSEPDAILQLQQVWPHEPTLQGCCKVFVVRKR